MSDLTIMGVVKLLPLPGSPGYAGSFDAIIESAHHEAAIFQAAGADSLIIENYGDAPFFPNTQEPETVAAMAAVGWELRRSVNVPLGVNVLRNSWKASIAIATILRAEFVRINILTDALVTDQGIIEGQAAELQRYRKLIGGERVKIYADIYSKHAAPLAVRPLRVVAQDMVDRALADGIIVDGVDSWSPPDERDVIEVREAVPNVPIIVGSGFSEKGLHLLPLINGGIIGYGSLMDRGILPDGSRDPRAVDRLRDFVNGARSRALDMGRPRMATGAGS